MDAVEFLKEWKRMCNVVRDGGRVYNPIECAVGGSCDRCEAWVIANPEQAVENIEEWAEEHPVKTRMQDFLEKHPGAPLEHGYPVACAEFCGYGMCAERAPKSCQKCWNRPLEEEK